MSTAHDFPEVRWQGHWIWTPDDVIEFGFETSGDEQKKRRESTVLFRRSVRLSAAPQHAPARMTADSRYALYINGIELSRGPVRSQPRRMMYDIVDLAPALRPGINVITVIVKNYGRGNSYYIPAVPNTGLGKTGAFVFEANLGDAGWLVSDDSWRTLRCTAWDFDALDDGNVIAMGVPVEVLDARLLPFDWQASSFDDSSWKPAQLLRSIHIGGYARSQPPSDPYGPLHPRTIAQLGGETVTAAQATLQRLHDDVGPAVIMPAQRMIRSLALSSDAAASVTLPIIIERTSPCTRIMIDFGRIVAGAVRLIVRAPAGVVFDLAYPEDLLTGGENGPLAPATGSRYISRGEHDDFETFDVNGLRYVYILVHGVGDPVTIEHIAVHERLYPWTPGADFESSDAAINRMYRAGIRTVELNSHDAFLDCPTREQRAWVGDSVVHQMVHLATNCDWRLAWQYLFLGASPRYDGILPMSVSGDFEAAGGYTIPEWSLHWVHGVYNLYRFSGDAALVKEYMPVVERILRWYAPYQTRAGVIKDLPEWCLMDWGAQFLEDTSSIHTAIWARSLREFAEMATWLEENASRRWAEGLYERAQAGFEMFWDEERGVYVDHIKDGVRRPAVSQIACALAVASGLAPRARWQRIMNTATDSRRLVVRTWTGGDDGGYSMPKLLRQMQGIYEADWDVENEITLAQPFMSYVVHDALAAADMAASIPSLAGRWNEFLHNGYDTFGECWGWGTHVHGWSSTLTRDFIFYTLGVTPATPGYTHARIAPRLGPLTWVRGSVPTPYGLIRVEVEVQGNIVRIESPVPFTLDLPNQPARSFDPGRYKLP
ncbi:MAG: family 78 glycoside hydrolase catalytic domain [Chloroflexi bacterium]|nr:family 78 glycoside hydrolase catalytic domain [Chloroflexota bacterium]